MSEDPLRIKARRILVIAPHPDDESLGCGGLITALVRDGRDVLVVFVTEGGASHLGSPTWPRERLIAQRRREAVAALARLGLSEEQAVFMGLRDAAMPQAGSDEEASARQRLCSIISEFRPDLALLPWRRDPHCDHRDAGALCRAAMVDAGVSPDVLEYAVWLDEIGAPEDHPRPEEAQRVVFDVAAYQAAKRAAVAAHLTQTTDLIDDAPDPFRLTATTMDRLCGPRETYWRPHA